MERTLEFTIQLSGMFIRDDSIDSVQQVLQVLRDFENRSGLALSLQKTSFYASGLEQAEIDTIQAST